MQGNMILDPQEVTWSKLMGCFEFLSSYAQYFLWFLCIFVFLAFCFATLSLILVFIFGILVETLDLYFLKKYLIFMLILFVVLDISFGSSLYIFIVSKTSSFNGVSLFALYFNMCSSVSYSSPKALHNISSPLFFMLYFRFSILDLHLNANCLA